MADERQDSLREEERRMRQGPYLIHGQMESFGREAEFSGTRLLALVVMALVLIGAAIFLVLPALGR